MSASSKRDYYMSTISVIQGQRKLIEDLLYSIDVRLEELENTLAHDMEEAALCKQNSLIDFTWQDGYDYRMWEEERDIFEEENDKIIYDTLLKDKVKYCTCDTCWDVKDPCEDARPDQYEHRMD